MPPVDMTESLLFGLPELGLEEERTLYREVFWTPQGREVLARLWLGVVNGGIDPVTGPAGYYAKVALIRSIIRKLNMETPDVRRNSGVDGDGRGFWIADH